MRILVLLVILWMTSVISVAGVATMAATTPTTPVCQEDAVLVGMGDTIPAEGGVRWSDYECGPSVDDYVMPSPDGGIGEPLTGENPNPPVEP